MKKLIAVATLAATFLTVGCFECPEGTVACTIVDTTIAFDAENQSFQVRRTRYRTCVTPNECPDPPAGFIGPQQAVDEGVTEALRQIAALGGRVDRTALRIDVDTAVADLGSVENAAVKISVARRNAAGELLRKSEYGGALELIEARADGWSFVPATDSAFGEYAADVMRLAADAAPDERIEVDYALTVGFDRPLGALTEDDIDTRIVFAGQEI